MGLIREQQTDTLIPLGYELAMGRPGAAPWGRIHRIDHPKVSRQHTKITWRKSANAYYVQDSNSTNGTWLNNARIDGRFHPLQKGFTLILGHGKVVFEVVDLSPPPLHLEALGDTEIRAVPELGEKIDFEGGVLWRPYVDEVTWHRGKVSWTWTQGRTRDIDGRTWRLRLDDLFSDETGTVRERDSYVVFVDYQDPNRPRASIRGDESEIVVRGQIKPTMLRELVRARLEDPDPDGGWVSRVALMDSIWGPNQGDESNLSANLAQLRQKFERAGLARSTVEGCDGRLRLTLSRSSMGMHPLLPGLDNDVRSQPTSS